MSVIKKISASKIKDSRGNPTLSVSVRTDDGFEGIFEVPSGASTGSHEAYEMRDEGGNVRGAIETINTLIASELTGVEVTNQYAIDDALCELDGTENKSRLGGNALIGVSTAVLKCAAKASGAEVYEYLREMISIPSSREVPYLFVNLINGGKHVEEGSLFQEHIIIPDTESATRAYQIAYVVKSALEELLRDTFSESGIGRGDEGGFSFGVERVEEAFGILADAIYRASMDEKVYMGTDVAATSFFSGEKYHIDTGSVDREELLSLYGSFIKEFNLWSIEDPFYEEDFESFCRLHKTHDDVFVIGDDLTVTNKDRIEKAVKSNAINAVIIKPNQIGTIRETLEAMHYARNAGLELVVSHRSGETMDDFIADLAYAFGCFGLKAGAVGVPERDAKYKRLIEISS